MDLDCTKMLLPRKICARPSLNTTGIWLVRTSTCQVRPSRGSEQQLTSVCSDALEASSTICCFQKFKISLGICFNWLWCQQVLSPFMLSETDPDTEAGELVARDCGADDTGSSTMTSMSLLLSSGSGGNEPGWSSLLREIWPRTGVNTDTNTGWGSAPRGAGGTGPVQCVATVEQRRERKWIGED